MPFQTRMQNQTYQTNDEVIPLGHEIPTVSRHDETVYFMPFSDDYGRMQPFVPHSMPHSFIPAGHLQMFGPSPFINEHTTSYVPAAMPADVPVAMPADVPAAMPAATQRRCYRCNSEGHILAQCPHPRAPGRKEPFDMRAKKSKAGQKKTQKKTQKSKKKTQPVHVTKNIYNNKISGSTVNFNN